MNFFRVEISDAKFDAAMRAARVRPVIIRWERARGKKGAVKKALGFEAGDVVAPPADVHFSPHE
jgi:hypothetical protein